jgi:hypothetical protein
MNRIGPVPWLLVASLVGACEGVPTLTFEEGDAAADVASDAQDAAADASDDGGCPGSNPPSAPFVCCGAVACEGLCTGQCDLCASKCTSPQVCCAKTNNVVCIGAGSICH